MGSDTVRYDDNVHFYHNNDGCGSKIGEFRLACSLERNDYVDEETNNDRSEWAMSQRGFMRPLAGNPDEFNYNYDYFGNQYWCWYNDWAELTQNWNRSDLDDIGIWNYDPSYSDETKTSLNTSLSASAPLSAGVSVSVDFPELKIQSEMIDKKLQSTYKFHGFWGPYDSADEDSILGTVTAMDSLRPDSGDKVAPTYMYGRFWGADWYCTDYSNCSDKDDVLKGGSTFNWFYEWEVDDL